MGWGDDFGDGIREEEGELESYLLYLVLVMRLLICYRVYLLIMYIKYRIPKNSLQLINMGIYGPCISV